MGIRNENATETKVFYAGGTAADGTGAKWYVKNDGSMVATDMTATNKIKMNYSTYTAVDAITITQASGKASLKFGGAMCTTAGTYILISDDSTERKISMSADTVVVSAGLESGSLSTGRELIQWSA